MGARRASSPGPPNLMKVCPENIRALIAKIIQEPQSPEYKKKLQEEELRKQAEKLKKHEYCDACLGGGEVVCCDKCPRSFHINCHIPSVNKQPGVEWLCKGCSSVKNNKIDEILVDGKIDVQARLNRIINFSKLWYVAKEYFIEIPTQRKYNNKLRSRKQLDKLKMIRKADRCSICKRGVLKGRLVNCNFCSRLYHVNCLEIPIRDWDHSMRWICPAHSQFFKLVYPELYSSDTGVLTDAITMKRQRSELPSLPVNTSFNIPSHVDALYKTPEEYIPNATKNSSLNILCDVASLALESINSNQNINYNNVSNIISAKFLASQRLSSLETNNNLLCKQPKASLSCLTMPMNISLLKKSLTIGKSTDTNICLQYCGNCHYVSDNHATITFDEELGDFLVKNHSRYGVIVDNVSYFGTHRPRDQSNDSELKKINSQVNKYLNKRRKLAREREMFRLSNSSDSDDMMVKYVSKKRKFNYKPMFKYYSNKLSNDKHAYRNVPCKCSSRLIPKDGYAGQAVLRNGSILSIGCIQFKFTYDTCKNEVVKSCVEALGGKQDDAGNKPADKQTTTDRHVITKNPSKVRLKQPQSEQENLINIIKSTRNESSLVTINGHCSLKDIDDTNVFNEQNNISILNLDNSEDIRFSRSEKKINGKCESLIMHNGKNKPTLNTNLRDTSYTRTKQLNFTPNGMLNKMQSCFANDLIQEVNVLSDDDGIIEEEIVYAMVDNSTVERISDDRWIIVEEIEEEKNFNSNGLGHSVDIQLSSKYHPISNCNRGDYKTEHLYCARSPSYNEPIVISDDDE